MTPPYNRSRTTFNAVLIKYFSFRNETNSLEPLAELMQNLRPTPFEEILEFLRNNQSIADNFAYYINHLFEGKPFNLSLTEANILSENAFFPEFKKRLLDKILPAVEHENSVWVLVDTVSVRPIKDLQYFHSLTQEQVDELFRILKIDDFISRPRARQELLFSLNILAWRVIGNAMDAGVVNMVPQYRNFDNPFLALQNELDELNEKFAADPTYFLHSKDELYKQIKVYMGQCLDFVTQAFKNSEKYGISGKINQSLIKIRQQLIRMSDILNVLLIDKEEDLLRKSQRLFFNILEYKTHKNNLAELFNESTGLISHLITNHTAEAGSHYITSTIKEYMKMLWKASAGGLIIGACSMLKILYSDLPSSDFGHAFMFAMNYAMCFIIIYLMGYTIATKQPAMTAATMAKVLSDGQNTRKNYIEFAHFVSKLFRSQFIAFVGNVFITFFAAMAVVYGLDVLLNYNYGAEKADKLLRDINMFESKALLHASIAGVFLFISGIISGNVGNSSIFYRIPERIAKNPLLNYFLGVRRAGKLSAFYARNWPGIMSNFWFGVFLGVTGPIGKFIGVDIDIRHITFSTGYFATAMYGKGFDVGLSTILISSATIVLIGFFNFAVSFGLSMVLAFRSRHVNLDEIGEIFKEIFRYFMKNPLRFFLPIRSLLDNTPKNLAQEKAATKSANR